MEHPKRRFTSDEVTDIVRRALAGKGAHNDISYDELEDIARQSGISPGQLESAIEEQETLGRLEAAKDRYMKRKRDEFFQHLRAYCIVNGALVLINLMSSPGYLWFFWPLIGWGIGLAFHAADALYPSEMEIEKGARRLLRKEDRRRAKAIYDRI